MNKEAINYQWIATGILLGYLSPYLIALIKSYWSPSPKEKVQEPKNKEAPTNYAN